MKPAAEAFDVGRKFVRVLERRPDGLVAFEFAIGEPDHVRRHRCCRRASRVL